MPASTSPLHLVDTTMFWSATGGGVRRYLLAKHAWLKDRRWRHTVIAPVARGDDHAVDCGGLQLPLPAGYRLPLARRAGAAALVKQRPDLIEAGDPYRLAWAALDAGQRLGVPVVAFCHSDIAAMAARALGDPGAPRRWAHDAAAAYLARTYRGFDLVLAPSRAMLQRLHAWGIDGARLQPLGVDCAAFHPRHRDASWRAALGLDPGQRVLLYVGRFAPEKNLAVLAQALRKLGSRYVLVAVGSGPAPPPASAQLRLLPYEADMRALARIYASVDAFVHAGDQETFGLAALEAMASGLPVALRAAGGFTDLLAGDAGVGVVRNRTDDWAEAIAALFAEPRQRLTHAALERARAHDWNVVLPGLLGHYRGLLDGSFRRCTTGFDRLSPNGNPRSP